MSRIVNRTLPHRPDRKEKKSYTLSPESVAFLENLRERRGAASASSVLDDILQALRREQSKSSLEIAVADYYSSLSDHDLEEQAAWGELALREFPKER